ncbi:MAG TPA: aldo/keto reductase, partial [Gammaproteobacteria bacterium]|nr:aldo/keto reductase [Gammaproteobacteria bacterium]
MKKSSMSLISLGRSSIRVAPLALGGNVFGWTADERRSFEVLDAFVAAGFNLVDTADVYSIFVKGHVGGESESTIGRWLEKRGRRDDVVIATKVGMHMGAAGTGLSRKHIMAAAEASLRRLKTDYIDLYQAHKDDPSVPLEETLGAFAELIEAGKVRAIGASNYEANRLAAALRTSDTLGLPRFETMQPWYNLYDRVSFEGPLQDLCRREELGVIPYFGLASGFLTGKYRSEKDLEGSARAYRVKTMMNERGFKILAALDAAAKDYDATPAQIALAWLRAHGVVAPIASATSAKQLEELVRFARIELLPDTVAKLDAASVGGEQPPP